MDVPRAKLRPPVALAGTGGMGAGRTARSALRWPWLLLFWGAWGGLYVLRLAWTLPEASDPLPRALAYALPEVVLWALATPPVLALLRRVPLWPEARLGAWLIHGLAAVGLAFALPLLQGLLNQLIEGDDAWRYARYAWPHRIQPYLMLYGLLVLLATLLQGRAAAPPESRAARMPAAPLDPDAARLEALRVQMNPHFLLNGLHTVQALVGTRPERVGRVLTLLGRLLRANTRASLRDHAPLAEELRTLEDYLEVERLRWGRRLRVEHRVAPAVLSHAVPVLLLQPLVENAVHYGVAPHPHGGTVEIVARAASGGLLLVVRDRAHGALEERGLEDAERVASGQGITLSNLRQRLRLLYGDRARLEVERRRGGAVTRLWIPGDDARTRSGRADP